MKKFTFLLFVMATALCGLQMSAAPAKAPARSAVYSYLPSGYIALGTYDNPNHIYYSTQRQTAVPQGNVYGISIIGEVDGKYYSTTYAKANSDNSSNAGAGFIAAMKVGSSDAVICNCQSGTTSNSVNFSARVEPAGEYAAKITYTLTSTTESASYTGTNYLQGSDNATTTKGDGYHYKLCYGSSGSSLSNIFGWYWGASNGGAFQIDGHKAWLVLPKSSTRAEAFTVEGDATSIDDLQIDDSQFVSPVYDLMGRRMNQPTRKGLFIQNGKKVIKK